MTTTGEAPTSSPVSGEITDLLRAWSRGDPAAGELLFDRVYPHLRSIAGRRLSREPPAAGLQTTELVHEAYLKLVDQKRVTWQSRAHFFAIAGRVVRRILVDRARRRGRHKRGALAIHVDVDDAPARVAEPRVDLLALDAALDGLSEVDPRAARVVEMRYFGGLSVEETAEALGLGRATVVRTWRFGRAWLGRKLAT